MLNHARAQNNFLPELLIGRGLVEAFLNVGARRQPLAGRVPADRADAILEDQGGPVLVLLRVPLFAIPRS